MPDDHTPSTVHVSLRVPSDLVEAFDRFAAALERSRSRVMLRALRQYAEDGEGREIDQDIESLAELDRGEYAPLEDSIRRVDEIIARAEAKQRAK